MKRLIIEFKEVETKIITEIQYIEEYERFNRLEILGLVANLLNKLSFELDKKPRKQIKK